MSNHALCPCSTFRNSILLYPVSSHAFPLLARTIGVRATSAVPRTSPEITASTFAGSHGGAVGSVSPADGCSGSGAGGSGQQSPGKPPPDESQGIVHAETSDA